MVQRIVIAGGQRIQILGQDLFESIQKAWEVKRSGGIPHRECRMVWPYQSPHIDPAVDRLWLENLPENLEGSRLADKLQAITELGFEELQAVDLPRGYGRD